MKKLFLALPLLMVFVFCVLMMSPIPIAEAAVAVQNNSAVALSSNLEKTSSQVDVISTQTTVSYIGENKSLQYYLGSFDETTMQLTYVRRQREFLFGTEGVKVC